MTRAPEKRKAWLRRRSLFNIRNSRLVLLTLTAFLTGTAATVLTAYLGIR